MNDLNDTQTDILQAPDGKLTLESYLASLHVMAECIDVACPAIGPQYYASLMRIRRRLGFDSSPRTLIEARESLETALTAYADQARQAYEMRSKDLDRVLEILDAMPEAAGDRAGALEPLIAEMRKRVLAGRELSVLDTLTGLANRRELERQMQIRLASGRAFCMLLFDIDDFGLMNESLGRDAGDQVLKQVGERITGQIRARDVACRWLSDEFIVLMECGMGDAENRATQMQQALRGPYTVQADGREAEIEVRLSWALAESFDGDNARQIWMRLEDDFQARNRAEVLA